MGVRYPDSRLRQVALSDMALDGVLGGPVQIAGFLDYNHSGASQTIQQNTWTDIQNDDGGLYGKKNFRPYGVARLMDTSSGHIMMDELNNGDILVVRSDFVINPNVNGTYVQFRLKFGAGWGVYYLTRQIGSLSNGGGVDYSVEFSNVLYIGDDNTRLNPGVPQIYCSDQATFTNTGMVIFVFGGKPR